MPILVLKKEITHSVVVSFGGLPQRAQLERNITNRFYYILTKLFATLMMDAVLSE